MEAVATTADLTKAPRWVGHLAAASATREATAGLAATQGSSLWAVKVTLATLVALTVHSVPMLPAAPEDQVSSMTLLVTLALAALEDLEDL